VPSDEPEEALPANVLTVAIILSLLVTDNVAEVMPVLDDVNDPADPQDMTTSDGFASVNDDASHFTQEETLKAEDPVGRLDKRGEET
jgi:hypothetical protein